MALAARHGIYQVSRFKNKETKSNGKWRMSWFIPTFRISEDIVVCDLSNDTAY